MSGLLGRARDLADRHSAALSLLGLAAIAARTWWLVRRDVASAERLLASRGPTPSLPATPKVSVLVAAWDEAARVEAHIRSFLALSYPNKELVLCAGGVDGTYTLARRWAGPEVKVLEQRAGEGKQRALRRCLPEARGEIIMLTDADCTYSDEAFVRLIEPIVADRAAVTTGVSEPLGAQRAEPLVQYLWLNDVVWAAQMPDTVDGVLGRNCALRREVLEAIGAFDAEVRTGTDYHMSRRLVDAGYQIRGVRDSRIATEYPSAYRDYLQMWRRWNKNLVVHGLRFGAWRDVRAVLVGALIYGVTLFAPILTPLVGSIAWLVSGGLFCQASANRLRRLVVGARLAGVGTPWRSLLGVPSYTCLDMLAAVLALMDSISPRLRSRW